MFTELLLHFWALGSLNIFFVDDQHILLLIFQWWCDCLWDEILLILVVFYRDIIMLMWDVFLFLYFFWLFLVLVGECEVVLGELPIGEVGEHDEEEESELVKQLHFIF